MMYDDATRSVTENFSHMQNRKPTAFHCNSIFDRLLFHTTRHSASLGIPPSHHSTTVLSFRLIGSHFSAQLNFLTSSFDTSSVKVRWNNFSGQTSINDIFWREICSLWSSLAKCEFSPYLSLSWLIDRHDRKNCIPASIIIFFKSLKLSNLKR